MVRAHDLCRVMHAWGALSVFITSLQLEQRTGICNINGGGAHIAAIAASATACAVELCRLLKSSDPQGHHPLEVEVNATHPEHGDYFYASMQLLCSEQPHHPNELAAWPIARKCARVDSLPVHCLLQARC